MITDGDGGHRLGARLMGQLGSEERAALLRCAVPSSFDEALYDGVLRGAAGPSLADLVAGGCVEAGPGGWGPYCVPRRLRGAAWESWWTEAGLSPDAPQVPASLRDVAAAVARWPETPTVESLRALTLADPDRAAGLFERAFAERDAALNFPGCQDLLDALAEPGRLHLLHPSLTALRHDYDRYLKARVFWHPSMVSTAHYLSRPEVEQRLIDLVEGSGPRALRVHASGGMGKSTALHWFISRRCVPLPWRVPCALVDFERVDRDAALHHPWLLLLECAAQLNLQMAGAPFQELLREFGVYRALLLPAEATVSMGTTPGRKDGHRVLRRFAAALSGTPVLLAFDTIEEATLDLTRAAGLVSLLADLMAEVPAVRVVLAGRGTAATPGIPGLAELLSSPTRRADLEIRPFDDQQSRDYLRRVRGLTDGPTVEAVAARAGGLPWLLSMYAEVALYRGAADPASLVDYDPDLAWCVDRVVARLDNELQWLVRYGVIARRLTRDFAERVLRGRVAAGVAGTPDDDPATDRRPPHDKELFRRGGPAIDAVRFAAIWERLLRYAAESSWVGADADRTTVTFHGALLRPLRRMLAARPVHRLLHADAVRYHAERARAAGPGDTGPLREELYHRFQLGEPGWGERFRGALVRFATWQDFDAVCELAADVRGPDYTGEDDPLGSSGAPVLDPRDLIRAHTEYAWALVCLAWRDEDQRAYQRWTRIERAVADAQAIAGACELPHVTAHWLVARVTCLFNVDGYQRALAELEPHLAALTRDAPATDTADLLLLHAEALTGAGLADRARHASAKAVAAAQAGSLPATLVAAVTLHARVLSGDGDLAGARDLVAAAVSERTDPGIRRRLLPLRASLTLAAGDPLATLEMIGTADGDDTGRLTEVRVSALLAAYRPRAALEAVGAALADTGREDTPTRRARLLSARARCAAALFDHAAAVADLDTAQEIWQSLRDQPAVAAVILDRARVFLDVVGDLRTVRHCLDEIDRLSLELGPALAARRAMLAADLHAARGEGARAVDECLAGIDRLHRRRADPTLLIQVAIHGLAAQPDSEVLARTAHDLLQEIRPPAARLMLLAELHRCPRPVPSGDVLLGLAAAGDVRPYRDPIEATWAAELYRIAGRRGPGLERALSAARGLAGSDPYAWWWWAGFADRAGAEGRVDGETFVPDQLASYPERSLLRGAYALLTALRRAPHRSDRETLRHLRATQRLLRGASRWAARGHLAQAAILARLGEATEARTHRAAAREIFEELDDPRRDAAELADDVVRVAPTSAGSELTVDLTAAPDAQVLVTIADGPASALPGGPLLAAHVPELVISDLLRDPHGPVPRSVLLLTDTLEEAAATAAPDTVRLRTDPALAGWPWEDLVSWPAHALVYRSPAGQVRDRTQVRALQYALRLLGCDAGPIDGQPGPRTRQGLVAFQRERGLLADGEAGPLTWQALREALCGLPRRSPRVFIVERDARDSMRSSRGKSFAGGSDTGRTFRRYGWDMTLATRLSAWHGGELDMVYLSGSMEASSGAPQLSVEADTYGYESGWAAPTEVESVGVAALDRLLRAAGHDGSPPTVVLDVTLPEVDSEGVRQVWLRNEFAHQLLDLGHVRTVIATGTPSRPGDPSGLVDPSAEIAAAPPHATPADVLRLLRTARPGTTRTALFSATSPDLLPMLLPHDLDDLPTDP